MRTHEPSTLPYDVWQKPSVPTRFVHLFTFPNKAAYRAHGASAEVRTLASILYSECLASVKLVGYRLGEVQ